MITQLYNIFSESALYAFARKIYFLLYNAFRETFIYKLFFTDVKNGSYESSFMCKIQRFFGKILLFFENIINKILKRKEKTKNPFFEDVSETSVILKALKMNEYREGWAFLVFCSVLLLTGIMPTMVVVGLCLITFLCMFFDLNFSKKIKEQKFLVTDCFVMLFLLALIYSRQISNDVQKNKIFLVYFVFVAFYFAVNFFISNKERLFMALKAFAVSSGFVAVVGMFQFVTGSYKTTTWTDTNMFEDIQGRLVATFENPNVFGEFLLLAIPITFAMIIVSKSKLWKFFFSCIALASCGCMILTYSRGCWLGLIFAVAIIILLLFPKLILPLCIVAPFSIFVIPETIIERITSIGNMNDGSTVFRVYIWRATVEMLKKYGLCGIGLGTDCYEKFYSKYAYDAVLAPHSHNTFLHVMCESGLFGLIVFVLLLFFLIKQLFVAFSKTKDKNIKVVSACLVGGFGGLMIQGMFDNVFYNYRMYMIFFAVLSLACAVYKIYKKEENFID